MSSNKQQTAVEIFWNQLPEILPFTVDTATAVKLEEAYQQAKQIEQEQHADTWDDSRVEDMGDNYIGKQKSFIEYYNETYGGNK